jgi:hypothetical protein
VAAAQPEQPLADEDVEDRDDVQRQRADLEPAHLLGQFVDLDRQEHGGGDHRQVLRPALAEPQPDALDHLDQGVSQQAARHHVQGRLLVVEGLLDGVHDR